MFNNHNIYIFTHLFPRKLFQNYFVMLQPTRFVDYINNQNHYCQVLSVPIQMKSLRTSSNNPTEFLCSEVKRESEREREREGGRLL